jgi:hypothetical protein
MLQPPNMLATGVPLRPSRCDLRGNRSNPWVADHVIFFSYRWLAWGATALVLLARGSVAANIAALGATALVNAFATLLAQRYVRIAQRNPLTMWVDIVYAVLVLVFTGGWFSPFVLYAYSSLVLPGMLYGWRGRVMAGLGFMWLYPAALWAAGTSPSQFLSESGWPRLIGQLAGPVLFACIFPGVVELLRRLIALRRPDGPRASTAPRLERDLGGDTLRIMPVGRAPGRARSGLPDDAPLAVQATKTRTTEQSVEDLRREIFMPLPSMDMDLGAALDILATRFGQHTGTTARVTLLGRTRLVHPIRRGLLLRLAQEALLNVQQHAHAASAILTLRYDASSVALLIQDDGVGLLDGTHERPGLHALRAMQYRLAEFDGRLDVFETEGGGVTVRATMPLE